MRRLPFQLHDFTRRQWVSTRAREVWEPRLHQIARMWSAVERESVTRGIRAAHLGSLDPERIPAESARAARDGLVLLPLRRTARAQDYSASSRDPGVGEPWDYRVAWVTADQAPRWLDAWERSDDDAMGAMLGYPACCQSAFARTWGAGSVDPTWAMGGDVEGDTLDVHEPDPRGQILGRWAGYRPVPHLPCSWDCGPTRQFADRLLELGRDLGHGDAVDLLMEALSWPYEWSALHGIAEIRSPILRITTRTDATAETLTVRVHSPHYPAEGARGTRHPYRTWRQERQQVVQIQDARGRPDRNGFRSRAAMDAAHAVILRAADHAVGARSVCDLGAGDGALLRQLGRRLGADRVAGVEIDADRCGSAVPGVDLRHADIGDVDAWGGDWDLVVLMPGRLLEMAEDRRTVVRRQLAARTALALCYGYGDWIERHGSVEALVDAALPGAIPVGERESGDGTEARVYDLTEMTP